MVTVLGASMVTVGIVEGIAEAAAAITKVFSGALSDLLRKRKFLMVSGYALAALTKPVFPLAQTIHSVFAARVVDRLGKGIRGAPRDALIADLVQPNVRGAAYGLRQALDSVGALLGPLLAVVLMLYLADNMRAAMWVATIPAVLCVLTLLAFVREPEHKATGKRRVALLIAGAKQLPLRYWLVVSVGAVFTLARFSEAFLVLRAQDVGMELAYVPAVMIVMNLLYAGAAYPVGAAADHTPARILLWFGLAILIAADLLLAFASSLSLVLAGAALWGLHMAFTQGLLSKLVADTAPPELIGSAFGVFNLVTGIALLLASVIAGVLWSAAGPTATFVTGAGFATVAAIGLLAGRRHRSGQPTI